MKQVTFSVLGLNAEKSSLITATKPTIEITFDGTTFTEVTKNNIKDATMTCNLGEEFKIDGPEGPMSVSYSGLKQQITYSSKRIYYNLLLYKLCRTCNYNKQLHL